MNDSVMAGMMTGSHPWRPPTHPLVGIVTALERAHGPVVAVACDQPFLPPELFAQLAAGPAAAVRVNDAIEPFPARYEPAALPALRIVGMMSYASHFAYPKRGPEELAEGAAQEARAIAEIAATLAEAGHEMTRISGGSTPTAGRYRAGCGLTEIRAGTYCINDRNQVDIGSCTMEQVALSVLATVVARPTAERAIIDAGTKGLDQQVGTTSAGYGWLPEVPGALVGKINDEHGFVDVSAAERELSIGEKVRVVPPRAPTCLNLYDTIHATRGGVVQDVWRITARGRNT